jgi:hypothetical protein
MIERKYLNLIKKDWEHIASNPNLIEKGKNWYPNEKEYSFKLSKEYLLELQQITGLFASFSPLKSVKENKKILINFLNGSRYGHTSLQMNKAELILQTSKLEEIDVILSGRKTTAFHRHLYDPFYKEKVCIDTHLIKYFNVGKIQHITPNRYSMMENTIKIWSNKVNMYPSEIQAILWLKSKENYGINV